MFLFFRKMNEAQQKNLLDSYCKEVLKRVKNNQQNSSEGQNPRGQGILPMIQQNKGMKSDGQTIFIGNDQYSNLSSSQGLKSSGMVSSQMDNSPGRNLLQNMELLNNFFSASGKNNFYNSLNSYKSSPMNSPLHEISQNDITFANDANSHLKINDIHVLDRSWNLDDDEINEFDNKNASETKNMPSKPKIQFIEQQRIDMPLRIKPNSNLRASAVILRSKSN